MTSSQASSAHAALASASRLRLLDTIRSAVRPPTATELAGLSGLQLSSVRFHLKELSRAGLIGPVRDAPVGRGRPSIRYAAFAGQSFSNGYQFLAEILAGSLADQSAGTPGSKAQAAGRSWAQRLAAGGPQQQPGRPAPTGGRLAAAADALFTELGFESRLEPAPAGDGSAAAARLRLHACPFLAMAKAQPDIVCAAHLGVLRGYLDGLGGTDTKVSLRPWDTPTTCLASITYSPEKDRPSCSS